MMLRKIKFGKITVVIFLTILIWVWADLALQIEYPVSNVLLTIAKSTSRALWVNFVDVVDENESLVPVYTIKSIVFKGSASRISEVKRNLRTGSLQLDFFLDAEQEGMEKPDEYPLDVLSLLRKSDQVKELGLAVQSCDPNKLTVNVVELVEKPLTVECFDEDGIPLDVESIEPKKVDMFVPEDRRTARVQLTRREREQARLSAVEKTPYVVLAAGQIRYATTSVTIKMSPEEDRLSEQIITGAKLGITLGVDLQGEYDVDVTNRAEVVSPFTIRATLEAKQAYERQPVQMILFILDEDEKKGPDVEQRREVFYNFPEESVRKDEIRLKNPRKQAKFKLIPLTSTKAPTPAVE